LKKTAILLQRTTQSIKSIGTPKQRAGFYCYHFLRIANFPGIFKKRFTGPGSLTELRRDPCGAITDVV
jgi:hypothetical protein